MTRKVSAVFLFFVLGSAFRSEAAVWNVSVADFAFSPSALTISLGDTVVWTNVLGFHNVVEACGDPLFSNLSADAPWVYQFVFSVGNGAAVGTYPYLCEVHPDLMWGAITVVRPPQRFDVSVVNFAFTPASVTVQTGDTVVWTRNSGGIGHNVHNTSVPMRFHSGTVNATWTTYVWPCSVGVGSYPYLCQLHTTMTGTVNVVAPPAPPAAPTELVTRAAVSDVILNWRSVAGATCYLIYRKTPDFSPAAFTELVGATPDTTFTHFGGAVLPAKSFYEVRAINN
ncbi:hypothetical protein HZB60_05590 [candidate division KSB1 bacterium]|nr:hypothetical protein [candidate division KSB1 bacterium]